MALNSGVEKNGLIKLKLFSDDKTIQFKTKTTFQNILVSEIKSSTDYNKIEHKNEVVIHKRSLGSYIKNFPIQ